MKYTREKLISICERAIVPEDKWMNRDSASSQKQLGECYAWLKAGCNFEVLEKGNLKTDDNTVWVLISVKGFCWFEEGYELDEETFYLPTEKRLKKNEGGDWY